MDCPRIWARSGCLHPFVSFQVSFRLEGVFWQRQCRMWHCTFPAAYLRR